MMGKSNKILLSLNNLLEGGDFITIDKREPVNSIAEAFDIAYSAQAMDNVEVHDDIDEEGIPFTAYTFKDDSDPNDDNDIIYAVRLSYRPLGKLIGDLSKANLRPSQKKVNDAKISLLMDIDDLDIEGVNNQMVYITLSAHHDFESSSDQFALTGKGNAMYVYGKMLACIYHFMKNNGLPALIAYSSNDPTTIPTYQKLLRHVAKRMKAEYVPISVGLYMLSTYTEVLENLEDASFLMGKAKEDFERERDKAKQSKIARKIS